MEMGLDELMWNHCSEEWKERESEELESWLDTDVATASEIRSTLIPSRYYGDWQELMKNTRKKWQHQDYEYYIFRSCVYLWDAWIVLRVLEKHLPNPETLVKHALKKPWWEKKAKMHEVENRIQRIEGLEERG